MKKIALLGIAASALLFFSCTTYTVQMGRERIVYPQEVAKAETKYAAIKAEEDAVIEAARQVEEQRLAEERAKAEALRVNEYPEDLSTLTYPFYYNPQKSVETKNEEELTTLKVVFVPLGEEKLEEDQIRGAIATLKTLDLDIVGFTGSLENQVLAATTVGLDAVTVEGGTIAFQNLSLKSLQEDSLSLQITPKKVLSIMLKDFKPELPSGGDVDAILEEVEELERQNIDSFIESISRRVEDKSLLFLTSFSPATSDWTDWTELEYRTEEKFLFSDILEDLKWSDTYADTHYSVETDPGITRVNGSVSERLDFLYTKGILPVSSLTIPLEKTEIIAIVADYLLP